MNLMKIAILLVLANFVPFTLWAVLAGGSFAEIYAAFVANPWTIQVAIDLVLALTMVCAWMWNDAKQRGKNPVPWLLATTCTGSIAPLVYFLTRPSAEG
jgi:hypothetical protein